MYQSLFFILSILSPVNSFCAKAAPVSKRIKAKPRTERLKAAILFDMRGISSKQIFALQNESTAEQLFVAENSGAGCAA
jgi:hypothetical protein